MTLTSSKKILIKIKEKLKAEDKLIINENLKIKVELLEKETKITRERRFKFVRFKE